VDARLLLTTYERRLERSDQQNDAEPLLDDTALAASGGPGLGLDRVEQDRLAGAPRARIDGRAARHTRAGLERLG
jgi:hypothetical protein